MSDQQVFSSPDSGLLATQVMSTLSSRFAYAALDDSFRIVSASAELAAFAGDAYEIGARIDEVLAEFVGCDEPLTELLDGRLPTFEIKSINRHLPDGSIEYYDCYVNRLSHEESDSSKLILVVDNQTTSNQLQQTLTQERNQLRLIQAELVQTNRRLQQLDHLKSLFLSIAAHDMRSPLSAIHGYAGLLLDLPEIDEKTRTHYAKIITDQASWLDRLIGDMLDLNRLEQGKLPVDLSMRDIRVPIRSVADSLVILLSVRDITLDVVLPDESLYIRHDRQRIEQILYNLIANSRKFLPAQNGRLAIKLQVVDDWAELHFSDNGRGMKSEQLPHLFKLYYQAPGKEQSGGLGLGLYIVKTLVEAHQGTIDVKSEVDVGTTFIMRFPLPAPDAIY